MEALQNAFDYADMDKIGRLDRVAILRLLQKIRFRPSLRAKEVCPSSCPHLKVFIRLIQLN